MVSGYYKTPIAGYQDKPFRIMGVLITSINQKKTVKLVSLKQFAQKQWIISGAVNRRAYH